LQLYPQKNHDKLIGAITAQGAAVDAVLPYANAQAADANIVTAIEEMARGRIDAIALTSSGQVRRLIDVARAHGCEAHCAGDWRGRELPRSDRWCRTNSALAAYAPTSRPPAKPIS
jgi:uroporphyrinogen-III synthase